MFCSKCGYQLSDDARFCSKCGEVVNRRINAPTQGINIIQLRCQNCNGIMNIDKDRKVLRCLYCGSENLICESDTVKVEEIRSSTQKEIELGKQKTQKEIEYARQQTQKEIEFAKLNTEKPESNGGCGKWIFFTVLTLVLGFLGLCLFYNIVYPLLHK